MPRWPASATPSPGTSPDLTTTETADPVAGDRGGHRTGGSSAYALQGHTHETPALPRWVRYLAAIVLALGGVVAGLIYVDVSQERRLDAITDYIDARVEVRDAERAEDLERTRLLICDLLVTAAGPVTPGRETAISRLSCPPPGADAYDELGD
jgi:hypothetical protein